MATGVKAHVGVMTGDPLRSLGLVAILEGVQGVTAAAVDMDEVMGPTDYTALMVDMRAPLDVVLQSITRLRKAKPEAKLIVMSETLSPEEVQAVIGAGAKGYVSETARVNEIVMAIEVVLDGSIWAPRKVLANLIASGGAGSRQRGRGGEPIEQMLTEREMDVLQLLMNGRSNREIAAAMGVESATVKAHIGRMLRKTKATNRVELTLRAMEEKDGSPDSGRLV